MEAVGEPDASVQVGEVADTFVALMRSFGRAKAQFVAAAEHDVEWSAQMLLHHLHNAGPMRAGALADCLQSDPSTVSRQVAALVKDGMIERRADPDDGRASILVLTARGDAVIAAHGALRQRHFARMLAHWSETDLDRFATLLRRFTEDFENSSATMLTERAAASRSRSPERI